ETLYRVEYAEGGFYEAIIRVADQVPFALVTERYDVGEDSRDDFWTLNLTKGWDADAAELMGLAGQGFRSVTYPTLAEEEKVSRNRYEMGHRWENGLRLNDYDLPSNRAIHHDSAWGSHYVSYYGVHNAAAREANPTNYPLAMVAPLYKGSWRRSPSLPVYVEQGGTGLLTCGQDTEGTGQKTCATFDVVVQFPMATREISWVDESRSDVSPFSCHEHDPALPVTYGQRVWGLVLANAPMRGFGYDAATAAADGYAIKLFYGMVGLDRYKDWVLEWVDNRVGVPADTVVYPRVFLKPSDVQKFRDAVNGDDTFSPDIKAILSHYSLFTGSDETASNEVKWVQGQLQRNIEHIASQVSIHHHHTQDQYGEPIGRAESALAWAGLSLEDRAKIRGQLALLAYLLQDPDVTSAGNGSHHGNPNMGVARLQDRANLVALLPDHPMHETWAKYVAAFMAYKIGTFMAPGGAWYEYGSAYHMHGYGKVIRGLMGVLANGMPPAENSRHRSEDLCHLAETAWRYNREDFDYYLNLWSPVDSRYGARTVPGMANSATGNDPNVLVAMGPVADKDPEFAANLRWAWETGGRMVVRGGSLTIPTMMRPWIPAKEPELKSRSFPGFGVVFRAHQGEDETCLFLRSGYLWSHWSHDQGNMVLYSKGAVLLPPQPYQYLYVGPNNAAFPDKAYIRFGSPTNDLPHGWADVGVVASAFAPSVDFAWAAMGFPDWYISPGSRPLLGGNRPLDGDDAQTEGAFHWNRMVMFMKGKTGKSPNYFVVRDVMTGDGKLTSWFNLTLLGRKGDVAFNGDTVSLATEWPTSLDMIFPGRKTSAFETYEDDLHPQIGIYNRYDGSLAPGESPSKHWLDKEGNVVKLGERDRSGKATLGFNLVDTEQHVNLRLKSAPGQEIPWIIYPKGEGEEAPKVTHLAAGVTKIETSESTDYVFMSPEQMEYKGEGIEFSGMSGAVRIDKDETVTLNLSSGHGSVAYRNGTTVTIIAGIAPIEKVYQRSFSGMSGMPPIGISMEPRVTRNGDTVRFHVPAGVFAELSDGNVGVRGMGPFDLTLTPDTITGTIDGDVRTIMTTWPEKITRPMYTMDGIRYYAGFADEHSITKDTATPQYALALGVTEGRHAITVSEWQWHPMPLPPPRSSLK
ncbi:MAG: hypothetical protein FWF84_06325, partial [Kiritimatiellaeota bacterium]|nr:hypothetical protein [Kiritimatiellota bacterium]